MAFYAMDATEYESMTWGELGVYERVMHRAQGVKDGTTGEDDHA
jgi:hypothetical protein